MLLTFSYLAVALFISLATPNSRASQATPSIPGCVHVLFVNFLHLGVLGAYTFRWLFIRERGVAEEEARQATRPAARLRR